MIHRNLLFIVTQYVGTTFLNYFLSIPMLLMINSLVSLRRGYLSMKKEAPFILRFYLSNRIEMQVC